MTNGLSVNGVRVLKGRLDPGDQVRVMAAVERVMEAAPPYAPLTPWGKPMSVRMTSGGRLGWYTDRSGYRYVDRHPEGLAWPPIPEEILSLWHEVTGLERVPDCCLVNLYREKARMGLHQDKDEGDFSWPVLSVSLGDSALFRVGGLKRSDPTESVWLESGDVALLEGDTRLAYHGIDRIRAGSSRLVPGGGRINLTLRVVELQPGESEQQPV